ncbi:MAG: hypothetical protein R3D52_08025 [Xanthobacteraceae bacterium]
MLLTFRLFVFAAGLVIVALAVTTRGLVPEPEARTRIGEVPSLGRSLLQQAIIPPALIERQSVRAEIGPVGELRGMRDMSDPAPAGGLTIGSAAGGSMSAAELLASVKAQDDGASQPMGGEDLTGPNETPDRAAPQDFAEGPPGEEGAFDREASGPAQPAPPAVDPVAPAPAEPPPGHGAAAPGLPSSGAVESLFVAPSLPSLAVLRPTLSPGVELAEAQIPADAPAMAYGAEPETGRRSGDANAAASGRNADSGATSETRPSKKTKSVKAAKRRYSAKHGKRSASAKSGRKVAKRTRKKVRISGRATRMKREAAVPASGAMHVVQGVPQTYQYMYAVPLGTHPVTPRWTSVR